MGFSRLVATFKLYGAVEFCQCLDCCNKLLSTLPLGKEQLLEYPIKNFALVQTAYVNMS